MKKLTTLILVTLISHPMIAQVEREMGPPLNLKSRVENYLQVQKEQGFNGAILLMKDGAPLIAQGLGDAVKEKNIPFTQETAACLGSVTKLFTALAAVQLEEAGKLKLNDPIGNYLSQVPDDKKGITMHQLLTHASGFDMYLPGDDYRVLDKKTFYKEAMASRLLNPPGTKPVYSNIGMSLAAYIIEQASGMTYEKYISEKILKPAGMLHTGFSEKELNGAPVAHGYQNGADQGTLFDSYRKAGGGPFWNLTGNGGLYTTVTDMISWDRAMNENKLISEKGKQKMWTAHFSDPSASVSYGYGYGVGITPRNTKVVSHTGSNGTYTASYSKYVDEGMLLYTVTNNFHGQKLQSFLAGLREIIFGAAANTNKTVNATGGPSIQTTHNAPQVQWPQMDESDPVAKMVYDMLKNKGGSHFRTNFKTELKNKGYSLDNDMVLLGVGSRLIDEKKIDEAIALFEEYSIAFPTIVAAWHRLGDAYVMKGDKAKATEKYKKALELRPGAPVITEKLRRLEN